MTTQPPRSTLFPYTTLFRSENKELNNQLEQFKLQQAKSEKENWKNSFQTINGINFLAVKTNLDAQSIRQIAFPLRKELDNVFLVVASDADAKPTITVSISDELVESKGLNAGNIVRELAKEIQGDRKSTRLNSSHVAISYAVFCLNKK